jgi:NADPH:quinone reductase-like Zn-dependent oxidoreductase
MKAIVYDTYGPPDVLRLLEIEKPTPKDDEVLVRIVAAGLNPYDWHFSRGHPYAVRLVNGLRAPRKATVLGSDMAGRVEAVGKCVTRFEPGNDVFAEVSTGACAEYISIPEAKLRRKPANLSHEQAAAVPMAASTAFVGVHDKARVRPGQHVLINGASGGVGTFAVQLAKAFGADVTGVCSGRNAELVRSIGADHVIDYAQEKFTTGSVRYDVILDAVGNHSLLACRRALAPRGIYGAFGAGSGDWLGPMKQQLKASLISPFVSQRLVPVNDRPNELLDDLRELIESGKVAPVIERAYPLEDAAEAMRHLEAGHVRGKIVVRVASEEADSNA